MSLLEVHPVTIGCEMTGCETGCVEVVGQGILGGSGAIGEVDNEVILVVTVVVAVDVDGALLQNSCKVVG